MEASFPKAVYQGARDLVAGGSPSWRELLYGFEFPKTYLIGEHSLLGDEERELPRFGVRVEIVPGTGHNMANENPVNLAAAIGSAIQRDRN
jgi:pimeloyl-ACP methyl ester carboxylesterase